MFSSDMSADGLLAGVNALSQSADSYANDERVEQLWAQKAFDHAEVYYNLLCSVDTKLLRLTPIDDEIYADFKETFPHFKVDVIDEDYLKSVGQKGLWREFCENYKTKIQDYNFGTLLRLRCDEDYSTITTTLVPLIQFYAIEIARNREGLNDVIRHKKRLENERNIAEEIARCGR